MHKEIWKDIKDYEGLYQVSNFGKVKSLSRKYKNGLGYFVYLRERVKKQRIRGGYKCVTISKDGFKKNFCVHVLVAQSFLGNLSMVVNHKDGDKQNNNLVNLELVTHRENITHSYLSRKKSSSFIGVYPRKSTSNPWGSCICINGSTQYLGCFKTEAKAHQAYLNALRSNNIQNKYA